MTAETFIEREFMKITGAGEAASLSSSNAREHYLLQLLELLLKELKSNSHLTRHEVAVPR